MGMRLHDILLDDHREAVLDTIQRMEEGKKQERIEHECDGCIFETTITAYEEEGKRKYTLLARDVTNRKKEWNALHKREQELKTLIQDEIQNHNQTFSYFQESEAKFRGLMDNVPNVGVQGYTTEGVIIYWNKASEEMYGFSKEEALGKNICDLIIPSEIQSIFQKAMKQGGEMQESGSFFPGGEMEFLNQEEKRIPTHALHTAVCIFQKPPLLFCINLNLTERKKAEEDIKQKLHVQKVLARMSSFFVGNIQFSSAIKKALGEMGVLFEARRVQLFLFDEKRERLVQQEEWRRRGIHKNPLYQKGFLPSDLPHFFSRLQRGHHYIMKNKEEIPKKARAEKKLFEALEFSSFSAFPLHIGEEFLGFFCLEDMILDGDLSVFTLVTEIFRNALDQKISEDRNREMSKKLLDSYRHLGVVNRQISILLSLGKQGKRQRKEFLDILIDSAIGLSQAQSAALFLVEDGQASFLREEGFGRKNAEQLPRIPWEKEILLSSLKNTKKRIQLKRSDSPKTHTLLKKENEILLTFPVLWDGNLTGILFLGFAHHETFTAQELDFYEVFSLQLSTSFYQMQKKEGTSKEKEDTPLRLRN